MQISCVADTRTRGMPPEHPSVSNPAGAADLPPVNNPGAQRRRPGHPPSLFGARHYEQPGEKVATVLETSVGGGGAAEGGGGDGGTPRMGITRDTTLMP